MSEANVNTTEIEIPQVMQMDQSPPPEPIKSENGEPVPFKDDARDAIFAKRRQILEDEMEAQGFSPEAEDPETAPVIIAKAEPKIEARVVPEVQPEPPANPEQEEFLLNVYGQQRKLTKDELIREAQKGLAASQIFHEGHRMREEALQIAQAVKQNLQPAQVAKENPPQATQILDDSQAREIAKRINYGSEEDQVKALQDLGASIEARVRGQSNSLPPEQLVNYATQHTMAAIKAETEQETLKAEFGDILKDQALSSAADVIANQLAQKYHAEGISKSRLELFREAGNTTRERYLKPAEATPVQAPAAPIIAVNNDKLERKRAAPKHPAAANKVASEAAPAYGVGVSSIVNQMRKARGQPVLA